VDTFHGAILKKEPSMEEHVRTFTFCLRCHKKIYMGPILSQKVKYFLPNNVRLQVQLNDTAEETIIRRIYHSIKTARRSFKNNCPYLLKYLSIRFSNYNCSLLKCETKASCSSVTGKSTIFKSPRFMNRQIKWHIYIYIYIVKFTITSGLTFCTIMSGYKNQNS